MLAVAVTVLGFTAVVMHYSYTLGSAIAPYTPTYAHTDGTRTALQPLPAQSGRLCRLTMEFTLEGRRASGSTTYGVECRTAPALGTRWQIAIDPGNPQDITVVDPGFSQVRIPWVAGFALVACCSSAAAYLGRPHRHHMVAGG